MDTTLTGLGVRLDEGGKAENLEPDFPSSGSFTCAGEPMAATIYAFKRIERKPTAETRNHFHGQRSNARPPDNGFF